MIMDITEKLGMQLARRKKEVVASVTKQLLNGNILDNQFQLKFKLKKINYELLQTTELEYQRIGKLQGLKAI